MSEGAHSSPRCAATTTLGADTRWQGAAHSGMRVVIDARYIADHFPGIGRYVYNLLAALAELDQPHSLVMLYNPDLPNTRHPLARLTRHPSIRLVAVRARPFSLAEQIQIPRILRWMRADLYHAPYYVRPYVGVPCPSVITLYDIIPRRFPGEVSPRARMLFSLLTRLAIRASQRVITISQSAGADLAESYGLPPDRIAVTPLAADARFHMPSPWEIAAVRRKYQLPQRYVLALAANKPHKNLTGLVDAWAKLRASTPALAEQVRLVVAGHWDPRYPQVRAVVQQHGLEEVVRFMPSVDEADLAGLYGGAEVFVFPSLYEGFGLPPLEAMACGAPVICGASSSLPEVVGEAALTVDVTAPTALAGALVQLLTDPVQRRERQAAGLAQTMRFSWHATAAATLQVYESVGAEVWG